MDMRVSTIAESRLDLIDSIRALALLGVILMNVGAMVMFVIGPQIMAAAGPVDFAAMGLDLLLFQGKARACFAFLFGLGAGMLYERAAARDLDGRWLHARRMAVLFAFGMLNQAFLFWGDILAAYAILGLALIPAFGWRDRTLLVAALLLGALPPVAAGLAEIVAGYPLPPLFEIDWAARTARAREIYSGSDYLAAAAFNWPQAALRRASDTAHMIVYDLGVLGLFMLGLLAARRRILLDVDAHRALLRRLAAWCVPVGLVLSAASASRLAGIEATGAMHGLVTGAYVGLPILAVGYMSVLALVFSRRAKRLQAWLAPAGRMSLTNYLASGAIGTFLIYGYGFGRLGRDNLAALNLIGLAIFVGLAVVSRLWLTRFHHGPAEWLWRSLAAGSPQPLFRRGAGYAAA